MIKFFFVEVIVRVGAVKSWKLLPGHLQPLVTAHSVTSIDTGDTLPVKQSPRRMPPAKRLIAADEVDKMLRQGIIEPSNSPWSSPIVLVDKKDGTYRFCVDFRKLNEATRKDAYPLPRTDDLLDELGGK